MRTMVYLPGKVRREKQGGKKNKERLTNDKPTTFGHNVPLQMKDETMRNNMRRRKLIF
jgi:hypothetical protein